MLSDHPIGDITKQLEGRKLGGLARIEKEAFERGELLSDNKSHAGG